MDVLISGCSFSAEEHSGWLEKNKHFHYPNVLKAETDWNITNVALAGCCNREIALRTVEACLHQKPDLALVQWTNLNRAWVYEEGTVDDYTILLPGAVTGKVTDSYLANEFHKIWVSSYQNYYMFLKHWLEDQILLQTFFQHNNIQYAFVRGFPNFVSELEHLVTQLPAVDISRLDIHASIKNMLHFDNNPDDYLLKKLLTLIELYLKIDKAQCIGYNNSSSCYGLVYNYKEISDVADDGSHPGKLANRSIADQILDFVKENVKL